ncbi:hypothetical protein KI387_037419, partial [Taxus chinensis]
MDVKAAARSKRAQSQRAKSKHTTKHPHSHSQSQSQSHSEDKKKNESKKAPSSHTQEAPKPHIAKPSQTLPTNWDRYEDPHLSGPEEKEDVPQQQETVPIKSKGADYAYLISQAQEQTGFDALMPAYAEGISSMLYVRGCNLLSWGRDDNFIVKDDSATTEYEASFLSLDLHGLASQLAQLERSKRLFVEEDKLPAEVGRTSDSLAERHQLGEQQQVHSHQNELRAPSQSGKRELGEEQDQVLSNEIESSKSIEKTDLKDYNGKSISSTEKQPTSPEILDQGMANLPLSTSLDSKRNVDKASGIEAEKPYRSSSKIYGESNEVAEHKIKAGTVRFEASEAEAELDALLDALDKPSNVGRSEVHGAISDPVFTEKSIYKGKQPFQDQLQGHFNFISTNNYSLDDTPSEKVKGRLEEDTTKNISGSKSIAPSVSAPKSSSSLCKDAPKVVEDDFDAWLDTI